MNTFAKRLLSACTALCILVGLIPAAAVPAAAAPATVEYHRAEPESAILNANTGYDTSFYEKLKLNFGSADYATYYNAVGLFMSSKYSQTDYNTRVTDDDTGNDEGRLYFKGDGTSWASSTLHTVAQAGQNLAANLSATLYNRVHSHKCGVFKKQDVLAFEKVKLFLGNTWAGSIYGSSAGMTKKYPRLGDYTALEDSYTMLNYTKSFNAFIKFEKSSVQYEKGTCTCGGAYAEHMLVTFRDGRSPLLSGVYFSVNGGTEQRSTKQVYVGAGQTLTVRVQFDEPIRFADDSAAHGDLALTLRVRGVTGDELNPKATLTKLDGNNLYFTYTVPDDAGELDVIELGFDSLYGKDLPLRQVVGDKSFTLNETAKNGSKTGFSTTASYITDLAGNPITTKVYNCKLRVDTVTPEVATVEFEGNTANADVKAALGKTDTEDSGYTDASDRYLGEGDSLQITIHFAEQLQTSITANYWPYATAVTNIIVDGTPDNTLGDVRVGGLGTREIDGVTYLTVSTSRYGKTDDGFAFYLSTIPIHDNLRVADADGEICVTAFEVADGCTVTDLAGNIYAGGIAEDANANPYMLDVTPPTVDGGSYTPVGDGFRYSFTIADDASGAAGIYGSFTLNNGGDGMAYPYEYVLSAEAETPTDGWTRATTGTAVSFTQVESPAAPAAAVYNYLFVRPVDDADYLDFSAVTLTVSAKDYAGNTGETTLPASDVFDFSMDGVAPTASAGKVSRALSGDVGTLTVEVSLADKSGIKSWEYSTDGGVTWTSGDITGTPSSFVGTASFTAPAGETTTKTLLVRATDTVGNTSAEIELGEFTYDLAKAKYALDYSTAIAREADLRLSALSDRDTVVFAVQIPASVSGADNTYAVLALTDWDNAADGGTNIFRYPARTLNGWYYMTVEEGGEGNVYCRFDADADTRTEDAWYMPKLMRETDDAVKEWWEDLCYGFYSGTVEVRVISGAKSAFTRFADADGNVSQTLYAVSVAGSDTDAVSETRVTLRLLSVNERDPYTDASLVAVTAGLTNSVTALPHSTDDGTVPATLEGVQLRLALGADRYGYGYENIDIENSYLRIRYHEPVTDTYTHEYRVPLAPVKAAADGSASQIITIPSAKAAAVGTAPESYTTGGYELSVVLACYAGEDVLVLFDGLIEVDATEPVSNRGFTSFRATPATDLWGVQYDYETKEYLRDGVIYLPTAGIGRYDFAVGVYSDSSEDADGNVTYSGAEIQYLGRGFSADPDYSAFAGVFTTVVWNTADGYADHKVELRQYNRDQSVFDTETSINITNVYHVEVAEMPASPAAYTLYLKENADNVIAIQQIYANGKVGDIVYRTVHPVGGSYTGRADITTENGGELVFTPDAGNTYTGLVRVYAGITLADGTKTRTEMTAQADGTYRMPLVARETGGAKYTVTAEDDYGNVFMTTADTLATVTHKAPEPSIGVVDDGDGLYTVTGHIANPQGAYTLRLDFDERYASLLPESSLEIHVAEDGTNDFALTALGGTGIYRVDTGFTTSGEMLWFDLYGVALPDTDGFTATVSATDAYGYTGTSPEEEGESTIAGEEPHFESFTYGYSEFITRFSQPVRPAASFTWKDGDSLGLGYGFPAEYDAYVSAAWAAAFPITKNGTQEISYYDVFGRLYTEEVDAGTEFYQLGQDRSIAISFSETALTGEAVTLTTETPTGSLLVFEKNPDGTYTPLAPVEGDAHAATQTRQTVIRENAELLVCRYDIGDTVDPSTPAGAIYTVRVYIDNIAKGAPAATVYYRLEAAGREFTAEELASYIAEHGEGGILESRGAVTARYETSRTVTPTAGGSEYTFTAGGETSHTFAYADDFGNAGSVTAALPAGLVVTDRPQPVADTEAPEVAVDIYAKRAGVLGREESFRAADAASDIAAKFDEVGDVQGYSLQLSISDVSMPCTVTVTDAAGVTLSGSVLTVNAAADFTVTVTDAVGNVTKLQFTAAMLAHIDNIKPLAETEIVASGLYTRDGYVRPYDADASGAERADGTIAWQFPADAVTELRDGKLWYKVSFTDNGTLTCIFRDAAGNYGEAVLSVSDIDTRTPTLTQTWSPAFTYTEDGATKYDESRPTAGPVRDSVRTHLDSDMPLSNVTVTPESGYGILMQPGYTALEVDTGVTVYVTDTRITVTYTADYSGELVITAMAGNNRTVTYTLGALVGVIDNDAPSLSESREPLFRSGSSVPYGYRITLEPTEDVYCQNYGKSGTLLTAALPLVYETTDNETRDFLFADKAGNVTRYTVTVDDLDHTPPTLTVTYPGGEDSLLALTNGSVSITVSADEACTLTTPTGDVALQKDVARTVTFTENGVYTLTATDAAGNRTSYTLTVSGIDHTLPTISFDTNTVYIRADGSEDALRALLDSGYTAWDNVTVAGYPRVTYDLSGVDRTAGGLYEVPYTVADAAGNTVDALRFVRVIGSDTLCLTVDGTPILPNGTAVLGTGAHTLTVENLSEIEPGVCEPYYIYVRRGIFATGQMKYRSDGSVTVASDGSFTVSEAGYYTLILTTQSRQTIRVLLYVEN